MKGHVNYQRRAPDSERLGGALPETYRNLIGWQAFGLSDTTTIKSIGVDTPVPFSVDRGGTMGIDVNGNGDIILKHTGIYLLSFHMTYDVPAAANSSTLIFKNAETNYSFANIKFLPTTRNEQLLSVLSLAAGTRIQVCLNTPSSLTLYGYAYTVLKLLAFK